MVKLSARKALSDLKNMQSTNEQQRFGRMLFLAGTLHLLILLSLDVSFNSLRPIKKIPATSLDVTLTPTDNQNAPHSTLAIAPQNHQGAVLNSSIPTSNVIASESHISPSATLAHSKQNKPIVKHAASQRPMQQSQPMSRKRTISAAAHESKDAAYLARWQSYVEDFGNHHYPKAALNNNLRGELRLLVAVNKDGTVHEVSIRQSSGSSVLDQAAIDIVYNASPFEPLPSEIAQDIEILEIIRTWQFRGKLSTSV